MNESTLSVDEQRQLKQEFSRALGPLVEVPPAAVFMPDPFGPVGRRRRRHLRWLVYVVAALLLSGGGVVGARSLIGALTLPNTLPPPPTHPVSVPKKLPAAQTAISRQQAIAIAKTYLQHNGSHGTASSAVIVTRQTFEFDGHTSARDLPPYLWEVTFHHAEAPAPTGGIWANVIVALGTKDGKVYGVSWNNG